MISYQIQLEPDQLAILRRRKEKFGAPVNAQIRRAIDFYLDELGRERRDPDRRAVRQSPFDIDSTVMREQAKLGEL